MKITCKGCGACHWLPDMHIAGGPCRVMCPQCSCDTIADASMVSPADLEPRWHVAMGDQQVGPVSVHDVELYYQNGQIVLESYVWCEGMADWAPINTLPDFMYLLSQVAGDALVDGGDETRIAAVPQGADAGEETCAIDLNGFDPYANNGAAGAGAAAGGIVGMNGADAAEDDFSFDMSTPQQAPAPQAGSGFGSANDMVGARNENSVLFSLSSLQAVSGPSAAPSASSAAASAGAGLIDVKTLANNNPNGAKKRKTFEASSFDKGAMSMPNRQSIEFGNKKDNTALYIVLGVIAVALIGLVIALVAIFGGDKDEPIAAQADIDVNAAAAAAANNGLGVEDEVAKKAKEEAEAKAKAEEEAKAKAEEEAKAKAEEEAKAKAEEEAKAAEEEAAQAQAEEKKAETKKTETKKAETATAKKTETKKAETTTTKKTETKKAETKPAAKPAASSLSKADIQSVIRSKAADVRTCSRTSNKKGTMKVSFVIKADGRAASAKCVSPEFAGTPVASCVTKVVNGMKFPAPGADTPINNFPFQIQ